MASSAVLDAQAIQWDLTDLFSGFDDPKFLAVIESAPQTAEAFAQRYRGRLCTLSGDALAEAFQALEVCLIPLYEASQFVHLQFSIDTANTEIQHWVQTMDELETVVQNHSLFFNLELGTLTEAQCEAVLAESSALTVYAYTLRRIVRNAQYYLTEAEEKIVNLKTINGAQAFENLYNELTASFQFTLTVDGEEKTMNGAQLRALRQHADPAVRNTAMRLFFERYETHAIPLSKSFLAIIKDSVQSCQLRGYASPIDVMNQRNDLPTKVVDNLHAVTQASNTLVQRYYRLKKKILGLDSLTLSDIYAPMPTADAVYSFAQAKTIVLDALADFDADFHAKARRMFDENRIHAPVMPTKQGGAYCSSSTHRVNPYVMLNFLGRSRDVSTMAHELGHAIHAMYTQELPLVQQHAILPLCETASVFCEMIVSERLYAQASSDAERQALLTDKLEDLFATSHRQNMFSQFEQVAHGQLAQGPVATETLCELYTEQLRTMFGDSVTYPDGYRWEWLTIPHFISVPFYVYAYNFGNLLVLGLYQRYRENPAAFMAPFKRLLAMGKSQDPMTICQTVGVDLADPAFWESSVAYIDDLVSQLEELCEPSTQK
ncbi:M3 family oligoendopeptidase [Candidatus Marinamargulisbacteria bacterium]|jgi:oligoendopeptidase F|nr:M3 family oligoendopeptidase [Candidatus Marinamargulisbacteria bacterium]